MVGIAVATIVWLSAARNIATMMPMTIARISAWVGAASGGLSGGRTASTVVVVAGKTGFGVSSPGSRMATCSGVISGSSRRDQSQAVAYIRRKMSANL